MLNKLHDPSPGIARYLNREASGEPRIEVRQRSEYGAVYTEFFYPSRPGERDRSRRAYDFARGRGYWARG